MRKEVLFAIIIGAFLGLFMAALLWRANKAVKSTQTQKTQAKLVSSPKPNGSSTPNSSTLTISSPEHEDVFLESEITIAGVTEANSNVLIVAENKDYWLTSDAGGVFQTQIELIGGINYLNVVAFDQAGKRSEKQLTLVYTTELPAETNPTPTTTSDPIRQKVQEKLDLASNKPKAIIGSVTDKTENSLQIKNGGAEIRQAAVLDGQTKFVRITSASKDISFADVAIGDYVAALGYKSATGVLDSRRVLVVTQPTVSERRISLGTITKYTSKLLTVTLGDNTTISVKPLTGVAVSQKSEDGTLKSLKFTSLEQGDRVIISGKINKDIHESRSIFLLQ